MITNAGELSKYGPNWKTCFRCGLTASDMIGDPPRCASQARCDHMKKGESFGGPDWTVKKKPEDPPNPRTLKPGKTNGVH